MANRQRGVYDINTSYMGMVEQYLSSHSFQALHLGSSATGAISKPLPLPLSPHFFLSPDPQHSSWNIWPTLQSHLSIRKQHFCSFSLFVPIPRSVPCLQTECDHHPSAEGHRVPYSSEGGCTLQVLLQLSIWQLLRSNPRIYQCHK